MRRTTKLGPEIENLLSGSHRIHPWPLQDHYRTVTYL